MERPCSPVLFMVLILLPFLLYFTGWRYWWGLQLALQLILCLVGILLVSWRPVALLTLLLLCVVNIKWFGGSSNLPDICRKQVDHISGVVEIDRPELKNNLKLMKVEVWCRQEFRRWPTAELRFPENGRKKPGWYRKGDRIELRGVTVTRRNLFALDLHATGRVRVTNLTHRQKVLDRSPALIYVQKKGRYFLSTFVNAVYKALITADRSSVTNEWRQRISSLGISHLFAISGMHIGILYLWFSLVVRWLISFPGYWIEKGRGALVTDLVVILAIFSVLTGIGMPISAMRAFIMLVWWGLMRHFLGWHPLWFILCGTAVVILAGDPVTIGQLSFQLSFLSVAGIIQILPFLPRRRLKDSLHQVIIRILAASFAISLWLYILTMPLVSMLSEKSSLITPFNNVFHIYYLSFIFLPFALLVAFLTLLGYPFSGFPLEFYFYSILNFLGRLWQELLILNDRLNSYFVVEHRFSWQPLLVLLWIAIFGTPFLISLIQDIKSKS
jgi:ComEC/Rec2-related protein